MTQIRKRRPRTPKQAAERPERIDELLDAELFKALGDPTRLALLACLAKCGRGCSVGEISEATTVDLSVVSRHLALLARAGIVRSWKDGREVFYQVEYRKISGMLRKLAGAFAGCGCGCVPAQSDLP